jgi:phosphate transport system permease protein
MRIKLLRQKIYFGFFRITTAIVVAFLLFMIGTFIYNGLGVINWTFLTDIPRGGMTEGGIFPAIVGTLYLTLITMALALPIGIAAAIYLVEYAKEGRIVGAINSAIINLAGVPSIIYGLFGFGLFVVFLGFGTSILAGALTMSLLVLPIVIASTREALLSVPKSFREGSLALGATKWQTTKNNVLPYALPGMLTGIILAVARAAGETAPILTTAVFFFSPGIPTSPLQGTMALSTHIYYMATQHPNITLVRPITYGTALVLLAMVLSLNLVAIIVRTKYRRKRNW